MRRRTTDQTLAHPWFVGEGLFALSTEQTQCLEAMDLLPLNGEADRGAVTYAREGGSVSIAGGSLVFEHPEDAEPAELERARPPFAPPSTLEHARELVWTIDRGVRRLPAVGRRAVAALRRDVRDARVTARVIGTAFSCGVTLAMLTTWLVA